VQFVHKFVLAISCFVSKSAKNQDRIHYAEGEIR